MAGLAPPGWNHPCGRRQLTPPASVSRSSAVLEVGLASGSPRRRAILAALGIPFRLIAVEIDETPRLAERPGALARRLAREKAIAGAHAQPDLAVIGADTVVSLDNRALGKPSSADEARATLQALRGRAHQVITAVATARWTPSHGRDNGAASDAGMEVWVEQSISHVWMRPYHADEITAYIATGDPFDKAGSYAIQHAGFHPVEHFDGCYLNVVGLPLPSLVKILAAARASAPAMPMSGLLSICAACLAASQSEGPRQAGAFCLR